MPANGSGVVVAAESEENGSYRQIAESDDIKKFPNSNMVREKPENCPDGAGEKMLDDEKKLVARSELTDVKFVSDLNGDTKVDILESKPTFTGLTKEELLKYVNDPFWVRLRWLMFVLFWLIWLGMLVGAIYIIVQAPKCSPPAPKTWWQTGPIIDLDIPEETRPIESAKFFEELENKLPMLKSFTGIIVPEEILTTKSAYVFPELSQVSAFENFAKKSKEEGIRLIVDLTANFVAKTHEWFTQSENKTEPFSDYFIWRNSMQHDNDNNRLAPNNWLSTYNGSAWTFSATRKEYYLHQFSSETPDLNFRNPKVVEEFESVIKYWISKGASGVRLDKAKHLLIDTSFEDEEMSQAKVVHTDYIFNDHKKTIYQDGLCELLGRWRNLVQNLTDGQGLLTLKEDFTDKVTKLTCDDTFVVDLPRSTRPLMENPSGLSAKALHDLLNYPFTHFGENAWPAWQYKVENNELASEFRIITSLLPGVPIFTLNDVVVENNNTVTADPEFDSLKKLREGQSMQYGHYNSTLLSNGTLFAYTRLKSGNPGFVILYNPTVSTMNANMTLLHRMPSKVKVNHLSQNYNFEGITIKTELPSDSVPVSQKSVIVLTYVQTD